MHEDTWDGGIGDVWSPHEHSMYMAVRFVLSGGTEPTVGQGGLSVGETRRGSPLHSHGWIVATPHQEWNLGFSCPGHDG